MTIKTKAKAIARRVTQPVVGDILVASLLMWAGLIYIATRLI